MKLRFVELPTERIFNWLDPFNVTARSYCQELLDDWWSVRSIAIRKRFAKLWTEEFDKITGHFTNLEKSIKEKGILSPISCVSGPPRNVLLNKLEESHEHFPPSVRSNIREVIYTHPFGGSRVTIAQKLNFKKIPCVVHDFSNLFPNAPIVTTQNFHRWFCNDYVFSTSPPHVRAHTHFHIDNPKYNKMNNNTREAQRLAGKRAKERLYD